ncbi:MAG: acetylornithine/N-succinyldiaminopimelate aminotransferase [Gammaproteobacteria bacterium]|jgi:acetylornithine/N-succinyldiaminopimelate aminotransferase
MSEHLVKAYNSLSTSFTHGDGIYLWDTEKRRYLDALCGISVTNLGHNHPDVTEAIQKQASTLLHTSNIYAIEWQQKLANLICQLSDMDRVFFGNSGAEANEAAIKIARLYGHQQGNNDPHIIVMDNSFHGRTMATLSASGSRKVQAGFEPLLSGFVRAPYNDIESIQFIAENNQKVVAILVEPVQGEGGIIVPDSGYIEALRHICNENNWLLMLDEVQSGIARSGQMFAFQHTNITPDVLTLAKALGNGVPIGACVTKGKAAEVIQPGNHGSTFGGNPLACRAGYAVLESIQKNNILDNVIERSEQLVSILKRGLANHDDLKDVRNLGLLIGIEMKCNYQAFVIHALQRGLLLNVTAEKVIRLLPPLILNKQQTEDMAQQIIDCIHSFEPTKTSN